MPERILIPSTADFETAKTVHQKLHKETENLSKSNSCTIDFDAADPSLLSIQLAASCIAALADAGCTYKLTGHAANVMGSEQVVLR